jgi:LacI family transcriptional regulator
MVSELTAARVDEAVRALGYSPNVLARGLRQQRSSTVGVLIPDLTNPLFPPIIRGLETVFEAHGVSTLVANTDNDDEREDRVFASLRARQVDGFVFCTALREHPLLDRLSRSGIRGVLVNRTMQQDRYPAVLGDDVSGVRQVLGYLLRLGHRAIVHLAGPARQAPGHDRAQEFSAGIVRAGLDPAVCQVVEEDSFTVENGRRAMRRALDRVPGLTAVFAGNDLLAVGAMRELRSSGLDCPRDVSVVGYNDTALSADVGPGLTTVTLPLAEFGRRGAEMLLDPTTPVGREVLPVHLTVRGSTAPPSPQR